LKLLKDFLSVPKVNQLFPTDYTTDIYSDLYKDLKSKGAPIPTNDLWIAAEAIQYDNYLLTYDKHFRVIESV